MGRDAAEVFQASEHSLDGVLAAVEERGKSVQKSRLSYISERQNQLRRDAPAETRCVAHA